MKTIIILIVCLEVLLYTDISFAAPHYLGNWRWRNDNGDVYTASWKDSVNTPVILGADENIRLRIETIYSTPFSDSISLSYTDDLSKPWIPITNADTGIFFISHSQYLSDTMSYFDNQLLPTNTKYPYIRTITFDSTNNFSLNTVDSSIYELEYSLKPTSKIQSSSIYFFRVLSSVWENIDYPVLLTPPVIWNPQRSGSTHNLFGVSFTDEYNGTAVGENGTILRTTDGGVNWSLQSSGTTEHLFGVSFTNANNGTAVGENGTILRTTDGGLNWTLQTNWTTESLSSVSFTDTYNGTTVGSGGTILRTTNGGAEWTLQQSVTLEWLRGVCFIDANTGIFVGSAGRIIKTTDGGITWIPKYYASTELFSVCFSDFNNGTVVGTGGTILRTTDGGETWTEQTSGTTATLYSVCFTDSDHGISVGKYATILVTTNGGENWIKQRIYLTKDILGVSFTSNNQGWLVGNNGSIFKTTNNGITFTDEEVPQKVPTSYFLSNNFPNPFNPATTIKYSIPKLSKVSIIIYDILGREIETLVNGVKSAGTYKIDWNAEDLPSGVYFYQIKSGSFVETRKMILLK